MDEQKYLKRTIVRELLYSAVLQEERMLRVYLPPGYDEMLTYPVVYCQDGEQFFNYGRIATTANRLILDGELEPFIVVGVDVNMERRTDDYAPEGDRFDRYMRFFVEEMLPHIEQKYAVRDDADQRILAGDSLGGTVSLSGAFLSSTQSALSAEQDLSWLRIYQLIGTRETEVKTTRGVFDFLAANRAVRTLLEERKANLLYEEKPGEHLWGFWQQALATGLAWVFGRA